MSRLSLLVQIFSCLLITSCSSYYLERNEASYTYLNNKARDKEIRIKTGSGEELRGKDFNINKDSAEWESRMMLKNTINKSMIKRITYTSGGTENQAVIEFSDNKYLQASDIEQDKENIAYYIQKDSIFRFNTEDIKKVSIKSHIKGAVTGLGYGSIAGAAAGIFLIKVDDGHGGNDKFLSTIAGGILGGLLGLITGAILGDWQNFYFR
jgi:hypothetical protein